MHPGTIDVSAGLMKQFLLWVGTQPRTYGDTMEAWRTSCPRISVWEDAVAEGLVELEPTPAGAQATVKVLLTAAGNARIAER